MKIVVTGAAGFIGANLVKSLATKGHEIIGIDALIDTTYSKEIKVKRWESLREIPKIELVHHDLREGNVTSLLDGADLIFHLAAMPGLVDSWTNFDLYSSCNITSTQKLLAALVGLGSRPKFVHISTSSVYGEIADGNEETSTKPFSPYGVTKLAAENLVRAYASNSNFDFSILRYFSVYGPEQRPDMAYSKFISSIYFGQEIKLHGDGKQSRTNTYISDCIEATIAVAEHGSSGGTYNIAGTDEIDMLSVILTLENIMKKKAQLKFFPVREGDQLITRGNIEKLKKETGYIPKIGIFEGLQNQVKSFYDSM